MDDDPRFGVITEKIPKEPRQRQDLEDEPDPDADEAGPVDPEENPTAYEDDPKDQEVL